MGGGHNLSHLRQLLQTLPPPCQRASQRQGAAPACRIPPRRTRRPVPAVKQDKATKPTVAEVWSTPRVHTHNRHRDWTSLQVEVAV